MPFKIVQTREDGEQCLCVVPSGWEKEGILWWPKSTSAAKLMREENSLPSLKWRQMQCLKKREYRTIYEAEKELEKMEAISDTETEERDISIRLIPTKKPRKDTSSQPTVTKYQPRNFNGLVPADPTVQEKVHNPIIQSGYLPRELNLQDSTLLQTMQKQIVDATVSYQLSDGTLHDVIVDESSTNDDEALFQSVIKQPIALEDIAANQEIFIKNQIKLFKNVNIVLSNQAKLINSFAQMKTSLDYQTSVLEKLQRAHRDDVPIAQPEDEFKPIDTPDMLDALETSLKDDSVMTKYVKVLTYICGASGKENGLDCCYRLIDHFMTRSFLTKCSWTGIARDNAIGEPTEESEPQSKIALMTYKRIRHLFLKLVVQADTSFTSIKCDEFLKRVLKNSKQRLLSKTVSKHKNRPSNL